MWLTRPPRGKGLGMFMFFHAQVLKPGTHGRFTIVEETGGLIWTLMLRVLGWPKANKTGEDKEMVVRNRKIVIWRVRDSSNRIGAGSPWRGPTRRTLARRGSRQDRAAPRSRRLRALLPQEITPGDPNGGPHQWTKRINCLGGGLVTRTESTLQ